MDFRAILMLSLGVLVSYSSCGPAILSLNKKDVALEPVPSTVSSYKYRLMDGTEEFGEEITFDTDKQTETVHVDAHGNNQQADIITDFKRNLTMYRLPAQKICLLGPLDVNEKSLSEVAEELEEGVENTEGQNKSTVTSEWHEGMLLEDRFTLSDEMANLCAKYPIYKMEKGVGPHRKRRSDDDWCLCGLYVVCYENEYVRICRIVRICAC